MSWVIEGVQNGNPIGYLGAGNRLNPLEHAETLRFERSADAIAVKAMLLEAKQISMSVEWRAKEISAAASRPPLDVTIVVTTYNDHKFLPKCLASVIKQNAREMILMDDGSDTRLPEDVWKLVKDNGIVHIRHGVNKGLAAARNTAFGLASSTWVLSLDADDWFYDEAVLGLYKAANDTCDCVIGNLTENGVEAKPPMAAKVDPKSGLCMLTGNDWKQNMGFATTMFRRSAWAKTKYKEGYKLFYEDWHFNIRLWKAGCMWRYVPIKVYEHTVRPDSMLRRMDSGRERYAKMATEEL